MPPGGGIEYNGQWYTTTEWQQYLASGGGPSAAGGQPAATLDGKAILQTILDSYGLSGLDINAAWNAYVSSGDNIDYLTNTWLPTQKAFQAAFPAWEAWSKQGGTVASYVQYQNTVHQEARAAGFADGTIDQDTISAWINNGVSATEAQERILDASKVVNQLDKNSQEYLATREMGLSDGDLASIWFDPNKALPLLETKLAAAQIGGAAAGAGIGLGTSLAEQLARQGVTGQQAQQGFGDIANQQQLYGQLPGQQGAALSQAQQVGAEFGTDASAAQKVKQTAAQRVAAFQTGGGPAQTSQGFTGAGVSRGA